MDLVGIELEPQCGRETAAGRREPAGEILSEGASAPESKDLSESWR